MTDLGSEARVDSVLEDPGALAIATMYARSYLAGAAENEILAPEEELNSIFADVLEKFPEFGDVLMSDVIGRDEKLAIVERVFAPRSSEYFANFLRVLIRHGRISMLPMIRRVFGILQDEAAGRQRVFVRSARALTETSRGKIREQIQGRLGFEPVLQETVDPSLLGGVILQIGDTVYDSSLRSRLKQLRGRLVERTINEIQGRRDRFSHPEGD